MIYYFGTPLTDDGHFFFKLDEDKMIYKGLSFPLSDGTSISSSKWYEFPFDPESMPKREKKESLNKGDVRYYRENGYTIIAIEGSCSDTRPGSKSVFYTEEKITWGEFAIKIMNTTISRKIIKQMNFNVKWGLRVEILEQMFIN